MKARIGAFADRLDPRRPVDMCHGRNGRACRVQALEAFRLPGFVDGRAALGRRNLGNHQHVRAVGAQRKPVLLVLLENGRRKRTERLPEFDLQIKLRLHGGRPRIGNDRAVAKCPGTELRRPLKPAQTLALGDITSAAGEQGRIVQHLE